MIEHRCGPTIRGIYPGGRVEREAPSSILGGNSTLGRLRCLGNVSYIRSLGKKCSNRWGIEAPKQQSFLLHKKHIFGIYCYYDANLKLLFIKFIRNSAK